MWAERSGKVNYGDLGVNVVARLLAPFYIRNIPSKSPAVHPLALVGILDPVKRSTCDIPHRHIHVGKEINSADLRTMTIGGVI